MLSFTIYFSSSNWATQTNQYRMEFTICLCRYLQWQTCL